MPFGSGFAITAYRSSLIIKNNIESQKTNYDYEDWTRNKLRDASIVQLRFLNNFQNFKLFF